MSYQFILASIMICRIITRTMAYRGVCLANDTVVRFTLQQIVISAFLAFIITIFLIYIREIFISTRKRSVLSNYHAKDMGKILQRCYRLFPTDIIQFNGSTFHRGMKVHVTTIQMKDFEGQLIGLSKENMICVLTNKYIIAQELSKIQDIYQCETDKKTIITNDGH